MTSCSVTVCSGTFAPLAPSTSSTSSISTSPECSIQTVLRSLSTLKWYGYMFAVSLILFLSVHYVEYSTERLYVLYLLFYSGTCEHFIYCTLWRRWIIASLSSIAVVLSCTRGPPTVRTSTPIWWIRIFASAAAFTTPSARSMQRTTHTSVH